MIDYYKLFGLEKNCDITQVLEKYNEKMLSIDNADILEYTFKAKQYREGLEVLTNEEVKSRYDKALYKQYLDTYLEDVAGVRFSEYESLNKQIKGKVDSSIIDALIVNPYLGLHDFYDKYMSIYGKQLFDDVRKTVTPYFDVSTETLANVITNHYRIFHNEVNKPKQKAMAMN